MRMRSFCRSILVAAVTLTFFLLVAALLMTTRAVDANHHVERLPTVHDTGRPQSPATVARAFLPKSTAAYNGVVTPAMKLYVPWMWGGTSVLRVYNAGEGLATVRTAFSHNGVATLIQLPAGALGEIQATGVPTGTPTAAILTATQPIAAVMNDFGSEGKQATIYAAMDASLGQRYLALPDILSESGGGWGSDIVVQNVSGVTGSITIVYTRTNEIEATNWSETVPNLPSGQIHVFDPRDADVPEDFIGFATVRADQPIVAIVRNAAFELGALTPRQVYIYRVPLTASGSPGSQPLYFPFLLNTFADWSKSEIQFMNTSATDANVTLEVFGEPPVAKTVPGWAAVSDQQGDDGRDPDWVGPGRVQNAPAIHSLVWLEGDFEGDSFAAYTTPRAGANTWYLPYTDQGFTFSTYVAVQNLGDNTASVTLTHHTTSGTVGSYVDAIPAGSVGLYYGGSGLPLDYAGGIVVESDQLVTAVTTVAGRLELENELFLATLMRNH